MSNKRYYWLKLKDDFFEDDTIAWLEEQENGKDYVLFYLKLALKSLSENGSLIRYVGERLIPYDVKALSKLTNTPVDTVAVAMKTFESIGLISIQETGEIYMNQINEMIGSETRQAGIMRKKRALENAKKEEEVTLLQNVTPMLQNVKKSYTEIEIERDIEIDIDNRYKGKEIAEVEYSFILNNGKNYTLPNKLYNQFLKTYTKINVDNELVKMQTWIISNPTKRKTEKGMPRFINSWLSRSSDSISKQPKQHKSEMPIYKEEEDISEESRKKIMQDLEAMLKE